MRRRRSSRRETTCARIFASRPSEYVREARVELPRDRELQHAVAEELEPLVRGRPVGAHDGWREDVLQPLRRERVDQPRERGSPGLRRYWCDET